MIIIIILEHLDYLLNQLVTTHYHHMYYEHIGKQLENRCYTYTSTCIHKVYPLIK